MSEVYRLSEFVDPDDLYTSTTMAQLRGKYMVEWTWPYLPKYSRKLLSFLQLMKALLIHSLMFLLVKPTTSMSCDIWAVCLSLISMVLMTQGRLVTITVARGKILPAISFIQSNDTTLLCAGSSSKPSSTNSTLFPDSYSTAWMDQIFVNQQP